MLNKINKGLPQVELMEKLLCRYGCVFCKEPRRGKVLEMLKNGSGNLTMKSSDIDIYAETFKQDLGKEIFQVLKSHRKMTENIEYNE